MPRLDKKNLSVSRPCDPLRAVLPSCWLLSDEPGRHERNERMLGRPARLRSWPGVGRLSARSCIVAPEEIFSAGTRAITPSIPARTAWVLFWSSDMAVCGLGFSMPSALVSSAAPAVGPSPGVDCSAPICALACKKDGDEVQRREGPRLSILLGPLNPSAIYNLQSPLQPPRARRF